MAVSGRAAVVALEKRLESARKGSRMLERKEHILLGEHTRLELEASRASDTWEAAAQRARLWLERAAALDGADRFGEAVPPDGSPDVPASVDVVWGSTYGTPHPIEARCILPDEGGFGGSQALRASADAHREAVLAAAAAAAAARALRLVAAELASVGRRHRVLEKRRVPLFERRLLEARKATEQQELEEAIRTRWAARSLR